METQATVEIVDPATGGVVLRTADGGHVLAEQLDAQPLRAGQVLSGHWDGVGLETTVDRQTGATYGFFVQAYGLSLEGARQGMP